MDGTLIDTRPAIFQQMSNWFYAQGLKQPTYQEIMCQIHRNDLRGVLATLLPQKYREELIESAVKEINQSFVNFYMPKYAIEILNVNEFLTHLKNRFKIAIVTNASAVMLDYFLRSFDVKEIVDVAISADDVKSPKPNPEGLLKALDFLNVTFNHAIYVGDTTSDILAGKFARIKTVGVLSGIGGKDEFEKVGADFILENVSNLESILRSAFYRHL